MKNDFLFILDKTPRSSGGVRYQVSVGSMPGGKPWILYIPQELARGPDGSFLETITISVSKGNTQA
jgi:hypothetical protein